jgi:lantibiotic modifying enzyme
VDLSVCHGSSGVVQALLATAGILGEPSITARAMEYQELVLRRVRHGGFYTGSAGKTAILGYMLGWAGIGDTDLLLSRAATRVPLALRWLP